MPSNKPELDSARPLPLTVVRSRLATHAHARRLRRSSQRTLVAQPSAYLDVQVDGRETSYFEWLGAGVVSADRRGATKNSGPRVLHELHYGFSERFFYLRVDAFPALLSGLRDFEFRITLRGSEELRLLVGIEEGNFVGSLLDSEDICILGPHDLVKVAFDKVLEVAIGRRLISLAGQTSLALDVALWHESLPLDALPKESSLEAKLGADAFAWDLQ